METRLDGWSDASVQDQNSWPDGDRQSDWIPSGYWGVYEEFPSAHTRQIIFSEKSDEGAAGEALCLRRVTERSERMKQTVTKDTLNANKEPLFLRAYIRIIHIITDRLWMWTWDQSLYLLLLSSLLVLLLFRNKSICPPPFLTLTVWSLNKRQCDHVHLTLSLLVMFLIWVQESAKLINVSLLDDSYSLVSITL